MHPLEQQTILVTGATSGLGKALARELVERGATVLLHFDGLEQATADPQAYDADARRRLWDLSERLCGMR